MIDANANWITLLNLQAPMTHHLQMTQTIQQLTTDIQLAAGRTLEILLDSGGHWYGHGFSHDQAYPLERGQAENKHFAVNNIQSPVWMCSAGRVFFADTVAPLQVSINANNDGRLRISCPSEALTVRVFSGSNLPEAHARWLEHIGWPNQSAAAELFGDSFFCTWTQFPRCITQERILSMAREIRAHGFPCKRLLIDDRWENCFGELAFSQKDFPDPAAMFTELKAMGFEVWLWVTPFVNQEAANFDQLAADKVLVPQRSGDGAATFRWWGGTAGLVDVTGPAGRDWYTAKLQALLALGAEGFKIDGGDHKYQPASDACAWHRDPGASGYSDQLLSIFEALVPNRCEARAAWISQNRAILWREGGKDSHWGADNGLKALLTLGLHLSLLGYDQLIPDMVPGRVQTMNADDALPSDELMLRWTECSAFFPFLQFSYFPWNYAEPTASAIAGFAKVHKALEGYLSGQAADRKAPLLRPLWYHYPEQTELYSIDDSFLLGSDLLVAPVLDTGVRTRDIQLPPGEWIDAWTGQAQTGHLKNWPAPCPGVPLFVNAKNTALLKSLQTALVEIERGNAPAGTTATWEAGLNRDLSVTG